MACHKVENTWFMPIDLVFECSAEEGMISQKSGISISPISAYRIATTTDTPQYLIHPPRNDAASDIVVAVAPARTRDILKQEKRFF